MGIIKPPLILGLTTIGLAPARDSMSLARKSPLSGTEACLLLPYPGRSTAITPWPSADRVRRVGTFLNIK